MYIQQKKQGIVSVMVAFLCIFSMVFFVHTVFAVSPSVEINSAAPSTPQREVVLTIDAPAGTKEMQISNDSEFDDALWVAYRKVKGWVLSLGRGNKVVYVRFRLKDGSVTQSYTDAIVLNVQSNIGASVDINMDATTTTSRIVTLHIEYSPGVEQIFVSNDSNFGVFETFQLTDTIQWTLGGGSGRKTVYVQFMDANGNYKTVNDSILYNELPGKLPGGTLLRSSTSAIYYLGLDGKIHPYLHASVFHSWFADFRDVDIHTVSAVSLQQYQVGKPVCMRGGTWLIQFQNFPQLYAAESGCRLFPLRSEVEAYLLYGKDWKKRLITLSDLESGVYTTYDRGIHDSEHGVIDMDGDGLDKETEVLYGTKDSLPDTDGDGLSDFEEVGVWFTSPLDSDTDDNGVGDLKQILDDYISTGHQTDVAKDVYNYPGGQIIKNRENGKYYLSYVDGKIYFLANNTAAKVFQTNMFDEKFVIRSSPYLSLIIRSGWHVQENSNLLFAPTLITRQHNLYAL